MALTGDSLLTRPLDWVTDPGFDEVRQLVSAADAAFTNLEVTLPRPPISPGTAFHGTRVAADHRVLDSLATLGFDLFSLANNHATDYGVAGLADTLSAFRDRGLTYAGAGETLNRARQPHYLETPRGRIGLIAATSSNARAAMAADPAGSDVGRPGVNPLRFITRYRLDERRFAALNEIVLALGTPGAAATEVARGGLLPYPDRDLHLSERPAGSILLGSALFERGPAPSVEQEVVEQDLTAMRRWIEEARRQSDVVLVSVHCHEGPANSWGGDDPPGFLRSAARHFIDCGASVVIGHGPHRLRPVEVYKGGVILYSLGNFIFMVETQSEVAADIYAHLSLGPDATPADVLDVRGTTEDGTPLAYRSHPSLWESVLALCRLDGGKVREVRLYPIVLGNDRPRTRSGYPVFASRSTAQAIVAGLAARSTPFGTTIRINAASSPVFGSIDLG